MTLYAKLVLLSVVLVELAGEQVARAAPATHARHWPKVVRATEAFAWVAMRVPVVLCDTRTVVERAAVYVIVNAPLV